MLLFSTLGHTMPATTATVPDYCELRLSMRKLWEEHVSMTRIFIISSLANLPDRTAATKRLMQNQRDISKSLEPFYGVVVAQKFYELLSEHISLAGEIVFASKVKNIKRAEVANRKWKVNADQMAALLNRVNPSNWELQEMQMMMHEHLKLTREEVTARLQRDWTADVIAYDKVHNEILQMADALANGLSKQFPPGSKFAITEK